MQIGNAGEFGRIVQSRRLSLGITQDDLATRVDKTRRWLYDVERGVRSPSLDATVQLASALGLTVMLEERARSIDLDAIFRGLSE